MLLAGVLLKMGTYGLLRFNLGLFPEQSRQNAPWVMTLALIGIIYGALVAMVQPNMKKLIAYSSVSHLGFVVLGIFSFTQAGLNGAMFIMLAHGISTGGLFMLAGILHERRHTYEISEFGGLASPMPVYAASYPGDRAGIGGLASAEWLHWGISGVERRVPGQSCLRDTRGHRHNLERGLPSLDVPAGLLRQGHAFGKQFVERPFGIRENCGLAVRRGGAGDGCRADFWLGAIDPAVQAALTPFVRVASRVVGPDDRRNRSIMLASRPSRRRYRRAPITSASCRKLFSPFSA